MLRQPDFIPEPVAVVEKETAKELFKATLGFDFVFSEGPDGNLRCFCIEINGHDSGVHGVAEIPQEHIDKTHKILAAIRATPDPEMARRYRLGNEILNDLHEKEFQPSDEAMEKIYEYLKRAMRAKPTFKHAHHNPEFIENITRDKRLQEKYVPKEFWPRTWHKGENPKSSTGWWVIKPYWSRGGGGVRIASNKEFEEQVLPAQEDILDKYTIQEFVEPVGIDDRPISMRLLIDFQYLNDGTIVPSFITAYHRVAPYQGSDQRTTVEGKPITMEDVFVVNKARGATSAAVGEEEMDLARNIADKIIRNIAEGYKEEVAKGK